MRIDPKTGRMVNGRRLNHGTSSDQRPEKPPAGKWWEYPFDETRSESIDPNPGMIAEVVWHVPKDAHEWKIEDPNWLPSRDNWTFIRLFLRCWLNEDEVKGMSCSDIRMELAAQRILRNANGVRMLNTLASTNTPTVTRLSVEERTARQYATAPGK